MDYTLEVAPRLISNKFLIPVGSKNSSSHRQSHNGLGQLTLDSEHAHATRSIIMNVESPEQKAGLEKGA